jgi:hypothetical protein
MIIFNCKYQGAWEINGLQIYCSNENPNWDYKIEGTYSSEKLELLKLCIRVVLANPDKMYKLIYEDCTIIPSNYDESKCGVIDLKTMKVLKRLHYEDDKIVSFCLYGKHPLYFKGALKNIEQYTKVYPDIKCYFYVRNEDVTENMITMLEEKGAKVIRCVDMWDWYMMFTRFLPFESETNKLFLSRDTDCRLIHREIKAIEQFQKSGKRFHIIRDHPWHNTLILGGMWGAKNLSMNNLRLVIMQWCLMYINKGEKKTKGPDQYFLQGLYKMVKKEIFAQDEFFTYENFSEIIDAPRYNKEYIGEAYDENGAVLDLSLRKHIQDEEDVEDDRTSILIIQAAGMHDGKRTKYCKNDHLRECLSLQKAFQANGWKADVWGLRHPNFKNPPNFNSYDYLLNLENYEMDWLPDLSKVTVPIKMQWIIDLHCQSPEIYGKITNQMDVVLHATKSLIEDYKKLHPTKKHIWFPPAVDDEYFKNYNMKKLEKMVFVGNIINRGQIIKDLNNEVGMKYYVMKTGKDMLDLISTSKIHFNKTMSPHGVNYRSLETIALGTVLLTDYKKELKEMGFVDGENCLMYRDYEECLRKYKNILKDEEKYNNILQNGLQLAKKHSFTVRVENLINEITN